jgi:hypothetical protein
MKNSGRFGVLNKCPLEPESFINNSRSLQKFSPEPSKQ